MERFQARLLVAAMLLATAACAGSIGATDDDPLPPAAPRPLPASGPPSDGPRPTPLPGPQPGPEAPPGPTCGPALPRIDDAALVKLIVPDQLQLAPKLYTTDTLARLKAKRDSWYIASSGDAAAGKRLAAQLTDAQWRALITPYAAFSIKGYGGSGGTCPFCGKPYGGTSKSMSIDDLATAPFVARTTCCGAAVYEREADMPGDYVARPNRTEAVPHLDGTTLDYRFYVPPGQENNRRNWFCSHSEVWLARLGALRDALRALSAAAFQGDAASLRALAVIYDRLAETYPGYPLVGLNAANDIAHGADGQYLTMREYRATSAPRAYDLPAWYRGNRITDAYSFNKLFLDPSSGWQDGVVDDLGRLLEPFDLIRDNPATRAYSKEKYNDPGAWEAKVRKGLVDEARLLAQLSPPTRGNTVSGWIDGALKIAAVTQDPWFVDVAASVTAGHFWNGYYRDGMSEEGAINYQAMVNNDDAFFPRFRELAGLDLAARIPQYQTIVKAKGAPVDTLLGVESHHGDEHSGFFVGWRPFDGPDSGTDYAGHEAPEAYPDYGVIALRAGAAGRRMESFFDFESMSGHTHAARLNLQLFYEGVSVSPDLGYGQLGVSVTAAPWSDLVYPFEKESRPGDPVWAWYGYNGLPEVHNSALVDGLPGGGWQSALMSFQRFLGAAHADDPAWNLQFAETEGRGYLPVKGLDVYDRQLTALTLPDGRPLLLDVFRIQGGQRHDLAWHFPATGPADAVQTTLGASQPVAGGLADHFAAAFTGYPQAKRANKDLAEIQRLEKWAMPDGAWRVSWTAKPSAFFPVTAGGKQRWQKWMARLHDTRCELWGAATGTPAAQTEIIAARGPWDAVMYETDPAGKPISGLFAFKDAMHYLYEGRQSSQPGLATAYLHVLEPHNPDQRSAVQKLELLAPVAGSEPLATGARVTLDASAGKPATALLATTLRGGHFGSAELTLDGRVGVAYPWASSLYLFDGTRVAAGDLSITIEPSWHMKLVAVVGDLTGNLTESALVVDTDRPLPVDATLAGRMVTVHHQMNPLATSGLTIKSVSRCGANRYRLDLAGYTSFIENRGLVRTVNPANPRDVGFDFNTVLWAPAKMNGMRVRFPAGGFETTLLDAKLEHAPPAGAVKAGDPVLVYMFQPGDDVVVPSSAAVAGTRDPQDPQTLTLDVTATGPATLTLTGNYTRARVNSPGPEAPSIRTKQGVVTLSLSAGSLTNGRAHVVLSP